jgi:hypothetical protein
MALFKSNTARVESRKAISLFKWRIIIALLLFSNLREALSRLSPDLRLNSSAAPHSICSNTWPNSRANYNSLYSEIHELADRVREGEWEFARSLSLGNHFCLGECDKYFVATKGFLCRRRRRARGERMVAL